MGENQTPTLYDFYGKQYDYNDLARSADQGLNEYLGTLRRGEKDQDQFVDAYRNIMSGIKDGTITFDNRQFHDSKGRYTNSDKKYKDYYGLMANYIYNKMGKSSEYQKPEDKSKIKWDNSSVRTALLRQLYNSDSENLQDFLDLDAEKDGVRAITNRTNYLADALQSVADNWDNTFQNYQDSDKSHYTTLLSNAAKSLRDGTIDPGDYLALSKAVGGIDFRGMMSTGTPKTTEKPTTEQPKTETTQESTTEKPTQEPTQGSDSQYKLRSTTLSEIAQDQTALNLLQNQLQALSQDDLIGILRNSLYNQNYNFVADRNLSTQFPNNNFTNRTGVSTVLNILRNQNKLQNADPNNQNLWYIPGLKTKRGTGWVWDSATNTIKEMYLKDIPYAKKRSEADSLFTIAYKEGGILKAQSGSPAPSRSYNNIYAEDGQDFGYNTYLNKIFQQKSVIDRMKEMYSGSQTAMADYEKAVLGNINDRYNAKINNFNNSKTYTPSESVRTLNTNYQNGGNTFNYTLFGSNADDYNNRTGGALYGLTKFSRPTTPMGTGDRYNNDKAKDYIDNAAGLQTYSRVMSLTDKAQKDFGEWGDFWKNQGATGAYYATDKDGKGQWIPTSDTTKENYRMFAKNVDNNPSQVLEATTKVSPPTTFETSQTKPQTESNINLTNETQKKSNIKTDLKNVAQNIAPQIIGAGRMFYSMRQNEKIANTLLDAMKPKIHNTYELYSPVTGAFSEMQNDYQRGAELRSQAAKFNTSDSSTNLANYLDTNRRVNQIQREGFLADDKEIKRTKAEALARQEDNAKRRSDLANSNMDNIVDTNIAKSQIRAEKLKNNWQSVDNFMQDIQNIAQENVNYKKQLKRDLEESKRQANSQFDMQPFALHNQYQQQRLANYYDTERNKLVQQLKADFKAKGIDIIGDDTSWQSDPIYKTYLDNYYKLRDQEAKDSYELSQYQTGQTRDVYNKIYNNTMTGSRTTNPFGTSPSTRVEDYNWYKILNGIQSSKKGGKLSPTIQYLLKKAMQ